MYSTPKLNRRDDLNACLGECRNDLLKHWTTHTYCSRKIPFKRAMPKYHRMERGKSLLLVSNLTTEEGRTFALLMSNDQLMATTYDCPSVIPDCPRGEEKESVEVQPSNWAMSDRLASTSTQSDRNQPREHVCILTCRSSVDLPGTQHVNCRKQHSGRGKNQIRR